MIFKHVSLVMALIPLFLIGGCKKNKDPYITPFVTSSAPNDNATGVSTSAIVQFTFNTPMDPQTFDSSTVTLRKGTTPIDGLVTYTDNTVTFTPTEVLAKGAEYTALVAKGVMTKHYTQLKEDFKITFTTAVSGDDAAPLIVSIDPIQDATGVPMNKVISVEFNEAMDPSSINATTFTLKNGTTSVAGTVAYSGTTATFTSSANLESNTLYSAELTADAKDVSGNSLASGSTWSFTTGNTTATLATVALGGAGDYVILAKTAINNSSISALVGHLGLSPAATTYITGLGLVNGTGYATSAQVTGNVYAADMAAPTPSILNVAVNDMITAYNDAAGRAAPDFLELGTGNIGGMTLTPGLYKWTSTVTIPSNVTLNGGADDVWIFQVSGDLTQSNTVNVTLSGGAQAKNIFWQVAGEATFGANAHIEGNILSMTGVTFLTGASMTGRALAQTAVVMDGNLLTKAE